MVQLPRPAQSLMHAEVRASSQPEPSKPAWHKHRGAPPSPLTQVPRPEQALGHRAFGMGYSGCLAEPSIRAVFSRVMGGPANRTRYVTSDSSCGKSEWLKASDPSLCSSKHGFAFTPCNPSSFQHCLLHVHDMRP
eukprot:2198348-Prymnesium_polylepis.1